jgi:hypothetical protein
MRPKIQDYYADYKMDIIQENRSRVVWIHKDEQEQKCQMR